MPNTWVRELWGLTTGVDEGIDGSVLRWFGHVERTGNSRIIKRLHVKECMGSCWYVDGKKGRLIECGARKEYVA